MTRMACPFAAHRPSPDLHRQQSTVADLDLPEVSGDSLTLTHLNAAMTILTAPSNDDIHQALMSLTAKYGSRFPGLRKLLVKFLVRCLTLEIDSFSALSIELTFRLTRITITWRTFRIR